LILFQIYELQVKLYEPFLLLNILPHIKHFYPCIVQLFPFAPGSTHFFASLSFLDFICMKIEVRMEISQYLQRQKELLMTSWGRKIKDSGSSPFRVQMFGFESDVPGLPGKEEKSYLKQDYQIRENRNFLYPVYVPMKIKNPQSCILLLHGLNERNWDKYTDWAEYLCVHTGKPVILFPIAFHINRAPSSWGNPRSMALLMEKRKKEAGNPGSLSFANAALSSRLTEEPYRFYSSGRQTISDVTGLARQIRDGKHPLFPKGTTIDIFGYSIGSFLAEIMLMVNPEKLFSDSKLFIFCGGAIFRYMYGESKYIMDRLAYERLLHFYCDEWLIPMTRNQFDKKAGLDKLQEAFTSMITPEVNRDHRESFFSKWKNRIAGISLTKDKVMPYSAVEACMGSRLAGECFEVMDFPYEYSHEAPFPSNGKVDENTLRNSFLSVFSKCAAFLA
jgi:hypothetical protein